jgi:hypothetical protein
MLIVLKSRSLNLLESSGPVKACNGIALHFNYVTSSVTELCTTQGNDFQCSLCLLLYVSDLFMYVNIATKLSFCQIFTLYSTLNRRIISRFSLLFATEPDKNNKPDPTTDPVHSRINPNLFRLLLFIQHNKYNK